MLICAAPLRGTAQTSPAAQQSAAKTPLATVSQPYHAIRTIPLSFNPPSRSALAFDIASRRLFIPAKKDIYVIDVDSGALVGQVRKAGNIFDIALAPEINRGFGVDSDGHLVIFDLQTYAVLAKAHAGGESSSVVVDPATKEVLTVGFSSKQCKVFDAMSGKLVTTVKLGGYPFGGVADSMGHVYFELSPDATGAWTTLAGGSVVSGPVSRRKFAEKIVKLDTHTSEIENLWTEPSCIRTLVNTHGIGVDSEYRRLVVGCENSVDLIDADTGKIVSAIPFPPARPVLQLLFNESLRDAFVLAAGSPRLIIFHENSANTLVFAGIIANDLLYGAFDSKKRQFFIPKSDTKLVDSRFFIETTGGMKRLKVPKPVPGTFRIVVYGEN